MSTRTGHFAGEPSACFSKIHTWCPDLSWCRFSRREVRSWDSWSLKLLWNDCKLSTFHMAIFPTEGQTKLHATGLVLCCEHPCAWQVQKLGPVHCGSFRSQTLATEYRDRIQEHGSPEQSRYLGCISLPTLNHQSDESRMKRHVISPRHGFTWFLKASALQELRMSIFWTTSHIWRPWFGRRPWAAFCSTFE